MNSKKPRENLTGKHFNRITAISPAPDRVLKNGRHLTMWNCVCECGNTLVMRSSDLKSGKVISCGCYRVQNTAKVHTTHGATKGGRNDRLYNIWAKMRGRCHNERLKEYKHYGGRGITVCKEWGESYQTFEQWALSNGYKQGLSIDRIDVNGNYCPENCRWATAIQQTNNTRKNKYIEAFGKKKTLAEWAREIKIPYGKLYYKLSHGITVEQVVVGQ